MPSPETTRKWPDLTDILTWLRKTDAYHEPGEANDLMSAAVDHIERLRGQVLPLSDVPDTHEFCSISAIFGNMPDQRYRAQLTLIRSRSSDYTWGYGSTPAAALRAAIEKVKNDAT